MALADLTATEAAHILKKNVGAVVKLAADYMTHKGGSEWIIKSVNHLGGTCVVAVSPIAGGKGFFGPYKHFEFDLADAAPEPEPVAEAPAPVAAPDALRPRNEFTIDGFEVDAPLYELFASVAPDTDAARELFLTYAAEHSEFDTEFFDEIMRAANVRPMMHWSDVNVTQMLMLLNETQDSVPNEPEPAPEPEEDENGPTVAARMKKIVAEQLSSAPVLEHTEPEAKPAVTIHPGVKPYVASDLSGPTADAPKRRGRPPGAKNKPKDEPIVETQPAMTALDEEDLADVLDNLPPAAVIVEPKAVIREVPAQECRIIIHPKAYKLAAAVLADLGHDPEPEIVIEDLVIVLRRALGL